MIYTEEDFMIYTEEDFTTEQFPVSVDVLFKKNGANGYNSVPYSFKNELKLPLKKGDIVVVDTSNGLQLAKVSSVTFVYSVTFAGITKATKSVVAIVDTSMFEEKLELAKSINKSKETALKILTLQKEKAKLMKMKGFDPELDKMIEEMEELEGC